MAERDVERDCSVNQFVETLRRLADCLENEESFRIQVCNKRFRVPGKAELSIEHEVDGENVELELQLKWTQNK